MIERIRRLSFLEWGLIVGGTLVLALVPSAVANAFRDSFLDLSGPIFFSPWMHAEGVSTKVAIEAFEFSGPDRPYLWHTAMALVSILAFYVAGPGLFVSVGTGRPLPDEGTEASFQVGLTLLLAGMLTLGFGAVGPRLAMDRAERENANQQAQDQMVEQLSLIGQAAYQYYVLPDSLSGGGGSFDGLTRADLQAHLPGTLSESDWTIAKPDVRASLKAWDIEVKSDTLLEVRAARSTPYPSSEDDSLRGAVRVRPSAVAEIAVGEGATEESTTEERKAGESKAEESGSE
jgi:hypothetical protein